MSKHKYNHDIGRGKKAVQHGKTQAIGPLFNVRHPKKMPPLMKKTAAGAEDTNDGKVEQSLTGPVSTSNDT